LQYYYYYHRRHYCVIVYCAPEDPETMVEVPAPEHLPST
jgi:hypothetical protein